MAASQWGMDILEMVCTSLLCSVNIRNRHQGTFTWVLSATVKLKELILMCLNGLVSNHLCMKIVVMAALNFKGSISSS